MGERPPPGIDPGIADYYERAPEETRLTQGPVQLEEARTRELIQRFAPPPSGPASLGLESWLQRREPVRAHAAP